MVVVKKEKVGTKLSEGLLGKLGVSNTLELFKDFLKRFEKDISDYQVYRNSEGFKSVSSTFDVIQILTSSNKVDEYLSDKVNITSEDKDELKIRLSNSQLKPIGQQMMSFLLQVHEIKESTRDRRLSKKLFSPAASELLKCLDISKISSIETFSENNLLKTWEEDTQICQLNAFLSLLGAICLNAGFNTAESFAKVTFNNFEDTVKSQSNHHSGFPPIILPPGASLMLQSADSPSRSHLLTSVPNSGRAISMVIDYCRRMLRLEPIFRQIAAEGPPHLTQFAFEVLIDGKVVGKGSGYSKKKAKENSALVLLPHLLKLSKLPNSMNLSTMAKYNFINMLSWEQSGNSKQKEVKNSNHQVFSGNIALTNKADITSSIGEKKRKHLEQHQPSDEIVLDHSSENKRMKPDQVDLT